MRDIKNEISPIKRVESTHFKVCFTNISFIALVNESSIHANK